MSNTCEKFPTIRVVLETALPRAVEYQCTLQMKDHDVINSLEDALLCAAFELKKAVKEIEKNGPKEQ